MEWIDVSHEMVALIGEGDIPTFVWPANPVALQFSFGSAEKSAAFRYYASRLTEHINQGQSGTQLTLIVSRDACRRLFGAKLSLAVGMDYYLPAELRPITLSIRDCNLRDSARTPYRLAKCIELLCETLSFLENGKLVPVDSNRTLSHADCKRVLAARKMIDDQWSEKLSLDKISRACGLNRAKLTRGFRAMFDCSVTEAISERRLSHAGNLLIATELPVSSIGYECGYQNNASFARAFSRYFGLAPTLYREQKLIA